MYLNENHLLFVSIPITQVGAMFRYITVYDEPSLCWQQSPIATVTTIRVQYVLLTDGLGLAVKRYRVGIVRCRIECLCSFILRCSSSLSSMKEYLGIDNGGYLCTNVLTVLTGLVEWFAEKCLNEQVGPEVRNE